MHFFDGISIPFTSNALKYPAPGRLASNKKGTNIKAEFNFRVSVLFQKISANLLWPKTFGCALELQGNLGSKNYKEQNVILGRIIPKAPSKADSDQNVASNKMSLVFELKGWVVYLMQKC